LEIVGTFDFINTSGMLGTAWASTFVYIPDSVLPPDVALLEYIRTTAYEGITGERGESVTIVYDEGYIFAAWYSFVLNDARDADAFVVENSEALGALGFHIEFLPGVAGAQMFWESAEAILQTVSFNLAMFSIVSALVLVLVVFLYIRQRQKDYAIMRALGNPARRTNRQLIFTILLIALPTVIAGGIAGWFVAQKEAARAVAALSGTAQTGTMILWLPLLIAAVLACVYILTLTGIALRRRTILEMLHGGVVAKR